MKSVKMMSALAALLSLGTAACQMPVEDEDVLLEQGADTLLAPGESEVEPCLATFRAEGESDGFGVMFRFVDSCTGHVATVHAALYDDVLTPEKPTGLGGELLVGADAYFISGGLLPEDADDAGRIGIEIMGYDQQVGAIEADYRTIQSDGHVRLIVEGKLNWY